MSSSIFNIATSALLAHRARMDVIGNNIANADTPGYTRRIAHLAATFVPDAKYGSLGTGTTVSHIERKRALFLEGRFRSDTSSAAEFDAQSQFLSRIEAMTGEPGDAGIAAALDQFFGAWAALGASEQEPGLKQDVVAKADQLAITIRRFAEGIGSEIESADESLVAKAGEANRFLQDIADLNVEIRQTELGGAEAMDLRDQRDRLLDQLAELAPIRVNESPDGTVKVHLAGRTLVDSGTFRKLEPHTILRDGRRVHELLVDGEGTAIDIDGGSMGAVVQLRDQTLPGYLDDLNRFTSRLIQEVNTIHQQGPGGTPFWSGTDATDVAVQAGLIADSSGVQTYSAGSTGGNELALAVAGLQDQNLTELGGRTFSAFYRDLVVGVGGDAAGARFGLEARAASLQQIQTQKEAVAGVSLDEEMANMIEAEHSYEAAARLLTTSAEMLDALLQIV